MLGVERNKGDSGHSKSSKLCCHSVWILVVGNGRLYSLSTVPVTAVTAVAAVTALAEDIG